MEGEELIAALVSGVFGGFGAAWARGRWSERTMRTKVNARLKEVSDLREQVEEDRAADAAADLRAAAVELVGALPSKSVFGTNLAVAQERTRNAFSRVPPDSPQYPGAKALLDASLSEDENAAREALEQISPAA